MRLGTAGYSSGMSIRAMVPAVFITIAFILPAVGGVGGPTMVAPRQSKLFVNKQARSGAVQTKIPRHPLPNLVVNSRVGDVGVGGLAVAVLAELAREIVALADRHGVHLPRGVP